MNYFATLGTFMRQECTDTEVTKSLIQSTLRNNDIFGTVLCVHLQLKFFLCIPEFLYQVTWSICYM